MKKEYIIYTALIVLLLMNVFQFISINRLYDRIDEAHSEIFTCQHKIDDLERDIYALKSKISDLEAAIDDLQ